jgi:hypothetical protein
MQRQQRGISGTAVAATDKPYALQSAVQISGVARKTSLHSIAATRAQKEEGKKLV